MTIELVKTSNARQFCPVNQICSYIWVIEYLLDSIYSKTCLKAVSNSKLTKIFLITDELDLVIIKLVKHGRDNCTVNQIYYLIQVSFLIPS